MVGRRLDAERDRDDEFENERRKGNAEGDAHVLDDDRADAVFVLERAAEIPLEHIADPCEIPF